MFLFYLNFEPIETLSFGLTPYECECVVSNHLCEYIMHQQLSATSVQLA